jgi:dolichol-phosphate mannosyltransferase
MFLPNDFKKPLNRHTHEHEIEDSVMSQTKRLVIVPTFNEVESIASLLNQLMSLELDVLIVDDGSTDGTINLINSLKYPSVFILQRKEKLGLGSAYRAGYSWALEHDYVEIIQMDADGSHQVSDLPGMLQAIEADDGSELIIGSRWMHGGRVVNWSKGRELLSRVANKYSQAMLGIDVKDSTAGFRIYRATLIQRMNISTIVSEGYCFQIEMTRRAVGVDAKIKEVPITFIERAFGQSKMSLKIVVEAMLRVTYWGLFRRFKRDLAR